MRKFKDWLFLSIYLTAEPIGLKRLAAKAWSAFLANGPVYYNNSVLSVPDDVQ